MIHKNNKTFKGPGMIRARSDLWLIPYPESVDVSFGEIAFHFRGEKPEPNSTIVLHDIRYRVVDVTQIPYGIVKTGPITQGSKNCGIVTLTLEKPAVVRPTPRPAPKTPIRPSVAVPVAGAIPRPVAEQTPLPAPRIPPPISVKTKKVRYDNTPVRPLTAPPGISPANQSTMESKKQ